MDLPLELNYKIVQDLPILDLEEFCLSSQSSLSLCSDVRFWTERFQREGLLLPRDISKVSSWIVEYKLSRIAQLREQHYMEKLSQKHNIILDLVRVNDVSILPDFLDKVQFAHIRDKRALQKNASNYPRKMLLISRQGQIKLDVGEGLQIELTSEQARVLLYVFCYYELDPLTDRETETYRVPRLKLEKLGLVKAPQRII